MKYKLLIFLFFTCYSLTFGQGPRVPNQIEFADLKLRLHDHVRKEIQKEVDALHRSEKYFNIKLDRVNLYFPIIERILQEENVPDDFKYLVIQESALISDAVSTSNAVGFWQFKIPSAKEVGLRVDRNVDERLNITASTHGAAKYLKRNNFYFNNWLYALLAYNMGVGGANTLVNDKYFGAKKMDLNRKTHWYLIKFLAHKIAFESDIHKGDNKRLYEYNDGSGKSLKQIAGTLGVDYEELINYNKWLKRGKVPEDKIYAVIIPGLSAAPVQTVKVTPSIKIQDASFLSPNSALYPKVKISSEDSRIVKINGIKGIVANDGEDLKALALIGGLDLSKFLRINEIDITHEVKGEEVFYFKPKKRKAQEHYHTVLPGEDLWMISQKYGVKKQKLLAKNRLNNQDEIEPGLVLWLRYIRAEDQPVEYIQLPETLVVQSNESIDTDNPEEKTIKQTEPDYEEEQFEDDEYSQIVEKIEEEPEIITNDTSLINDDASEEISEGLSNEELVELDRQKNPLFHIVESGETLFAISRKYKIPIDKILKINDLNMEDKISIGQKIYLRPPFEDRGTSATETNDSRIDLYINYEVMKGDTMYSISRKYNVSINDILEWNNKTDYALKEGEVLRIKK
jgi:membrane-bound lytic murein transglycosylase D